MTTSKMDTDFILPIRVYYEDTDAAGVVYNANYMKFAERCRMEFLRHLGVYPSDKNSQEKTAWAVRHCEIDFIKPAFLDDMLTVSCRVTELGGASMQLHQEIMRDKEVLVVIEVKIVYVSLEKKKPIRIPKGIF